MIKTVIPYAEDGNLGAEYNRIMEQADDIVMLLDHDVLLVNPHWHHILSTVFAQNPKAGMVTCYTNNIGTATQRHPFAPDSHDIAKHRAFAKELLQAGGYTTTKLGSCSGMLMALRKACYNDVGPFIDGFFKVDTDYSRRVAASEWEMLRANGLYVYHIRERKDGPWIEGEKTSRSFL